MMRGTLTLLTCASLFLFPWPLTLILALGTALFEPLVPLAIGLLADTLYYVPHEGGLPLYTLGGVLVTAVALLVRSRLNTSSIMQ